MSHLPFKPAWWLRNPHLQTLWPIFMRQTIKHLQIERERFELPDGDFLDLDWVGRNQQGPLVLVLHGFEGSIESHYAKSMLAALNNQGWRSVFMHFRGCSGEPNRLSRGYHSGDTQDVATLVASLQRREPDVQLMAIGFSLGGNVLLKWLGETGDKNPLLAAIAVSVPFELHKAVERIQRGFSRFYQWYFLKCLRLRLGKKFKHDSAVVDMSQLNNSATMDEFDNHYTAPLHGFSDAKHYYTASSSRQFLQNIKVPTLVLHAKDDPFMTEDVIPLQHELSPSIQLEVTHCGGHVGFVSGNYPWQAEYWLEHRVPVFFREHLSLLNPMEDGTR